MYCFNLETYRACFITHDYWRVRLISCAATHVSAPLHEFVLSLAETITQIVHLCLTIRLYETHHLYHRCQTHLPVWTLVSVAEWDLYSCAVMPFAHRFQHDLSQIPITHPCIGSWIVVHVCADHHNRHR